MAKELDRQRPFGTIHGDEVLGRHFEQDGVYFDARGVEWVPPEAEADTRQAEIDAAVAAAKAEAKAEAQAELDAKIAAAVAAALAAQAKPEAPAKSK